MYVKPTFFFTGIFPPPAACTKILARLHSPFTRCTNNTDETSIVQNIVRNIIFSDVISHLLGRPEKDWMVFDNLVGFIPFQLSKVFPCHRMFRTQTSNPNLITLQRSFQWMYLPNITTCFSVFDGCIKGIRPFFLNEWFQFRRVWVIGLDREFILGFRQIPGVVGIFEQTAII